MNYIEIWKFVMKQKVMIVIDYSSVLKKRP